MSGCDSGYWRLESDSVVMLALAKRWDANPLGVGGGVGWVGGGGGVWGLTVIPEGKGREGSR